MLRHLSLALAAAALAGTTQAQTIQNVSPIAASPGYLVTVEGIGLASTTHVRFRGFVGGFVGIITIDAPYVTRTSTAVTAVVPTINGWIPSGQQSGDPLGQVAVVDVNGLTSPFHNFYFYEGTASFLANVGLGTTNSANHRAVISFSLPNFPPTPGNAQFTARLERATPGSLPVLLVGFPLAPTSPFLDGLFAIDPTVTLDTIGPTVGPGGIAELNLPIPSVSVMQGLNLVMQWAFIDLASAVHLSNGLRANY